MILQEGEIVVRLLLRGFSFFIIFTSFSFTLPFEVRICTLWGVFLHTRQIVSDEAVDSDAELQKTTLTVTGSEKNKSRQ